MLSSLSSVGVTAGVTARSEKDARDASGQNLAASAKADRFKDLRRPSLRSVILFGNRAPVGFLRHHYTPLREIAGLRTSEERALPLDALQGRERKARARSIRKWSRVSASASASRSASVAAANMPGHLSRRCAPRLARRRFPGWHGSPHASPPGLRVPRSANTDDA